MEVEYTIEAWTFERGYDKHIRKLAEIRPATESHYDYGLIVKWMEPFIGVIPQKTVDVSWRRTHLLSCGVAKARKEWECRRYHLVDGTSHARLSIAEILADDELRWSLTPSGILHYKVHAWIGKIEAAVPNLLDEERSIIRLGLQPGVAPTVKTRAMLQEEREQAVVEAMPQWAVWA